MSEREELGKLCREVILRCELNHLSADESADEFAGVISAREEELVAAARAQALEPFEQLVIDMRAIGKMLGEHQLASVCEDYARRAEAAIIPSDSTALAKLLAKERLAELNLIPQSDYWNTGLEGYIMRRKDTLMDIVAARQAELKGRKDSV